MRLFEESRRTVLFVTSEVEEALFLADRLVILGNRPTRVRDIVHVPLSRPRDFHMLSSPQRTKSRPTPWLCSTTRLCAPLPRAHPVARLSPTLATFLS